MNVIFILIGVSITVATGFLLAFFWAICNGQFEDDKTPGIRMLFDQFPPQPSDKPTKENGSRKV